MTTPAADPALDRAILRARDKREQRGATGDARLVIPELTPEEALALDGLLFSSRRKPVLPGATLRVALSQFEAALSSCGIDDETRERVLEATVAFDLDLVMTSHELWGTYRSVPQLAIYQLHRENGTFGVQAIPFLWDGEVLRELEQDELLV